MITYSIIKKSQLEGAKRLDAEYYQPKYLDMKRKLDSSLTLRDISEKITDFGAYSQMNFVEYTKEGVRFFRNQDIGEVFVDDSEPIYISEETYKKLSLKLDKYDILTPRVGTLGNAAVILANCLPASANQNLAQIKPDTEKVDPVYLTVFLSSKFGRFQFEQLSTGNVQPWLNLSQLNSIKVFVPHLSKQREIRDIADNTLKERENSKTLYSQAENLLLGELGLKDFSEEQSLYSVVNFSELKETGRMDAEYFQPKYAELESRIRKYESQPLERVLENVPAKFDAAKQPDKPFKYVELSNINASIGVIDGFSEVPGKEAPSRAKRVLKVGDVIVSSVEGSLGKVALVHEEQKDFLASTGFFQFRSKEILPEVLLVLAKSIVFQWQLEKRCAGTILTAVPKESIKDMPIPILPKAIQQKIAELVRKSHEARKKANELLESAKRKVEELIERK